MNEKILGLLLGIGLGAGLLGLVQSFDAQAGTDAGKEFCYSARRDFYHGWRNDWPRGCGRQPNADYLAGLKQDCATTKANIARDIARGGVGSWPANWSGVYSEDACLALEFGSAL